MIKVCTSDEFLWSQLRGDTNYWYGLVRNSVARYSWSLLCIDSVAMYPVLRVVTDMKFELLDLKLVELHISRGDMWVLPLLTPAYGKSMIKFANNNSQVNDWLLAAASTPSLYQGVWFDIAVKEDVVELVRLLNSGWADSCRWEVDDIRSPQVLEIFLGQSLSRSRTALSSSLFKKYANSHWSEQLKHALQLANLSWEETIYRITEFKPANLIVVLDWFKISVGDYVNLRYHPVVPLVDSNNPLAAVFHVLEWEHQTAFVLKHIAELVNLAPIIASRLSVTTDVELHCEFAAALHRKSPPPGREISCEWLCDFIKTILKHKAVAALEKWLCDLIGEQRMSICVNSLHWIPYHAMRPLFKYMNAAPGSKEALSCRIFCRNLDTPSVTFFNHAIATGDLDAMRWIFATIPFAGRIMFNCERTCEFCGEKNKNMYWYNNNSSIHRTRKHNTAHDEFILTMVKDWPFAWNRTIKFLGPITAQMSRTLLEIARADTDRVIIDIWYHALKFVPCYDYITRLEVVTGTPYEVQSIAIGLVNNDGYIGAPSAPLAAIVWIVQKFGPLLNPHQRRNATLAMKSRRVVCELCKDFCLDIDDISCYNNSLA